MYSIQKAGEATGIMIDMHNNPDSLPTPTSNNQIQSPFFRFKFTDNPVFLSDHPFR